MSQIIVPTADEATGAWSSTPLWSKVDDDSTVNASGDGTTITSDDNTSPDNADFQLGSGDSPDTGNHILRARWNRDAAGDHSIHGELELWQGVPGTGTLIATLTSADPIETTEVEDTYTLSSAEVSNISDYTSLYLRLARVGGRGGPPGGREVLVVDLVELEIPDAAPQEATELTGQSDNSTEVKGRLRQTHSPKGPVEYTGMSVSGKMRQIHYLKPPSRGS